jgi:hypothetical protein
MESQTLEFGKKMRLKIAIKTELQPKMEEESN